MKDSRNPEGFRNLLALDLLKILGQGPGTFEIYPMPQDASMRRYYRIVGSEIHVDTTGDNSVVLMVLADPNPKSASDEISNGNGMKTKQYREPKEGDLDFVNVLRHFEKVHLPVPCLYKYNIRNGLLYLEDLGDDILEDVQAKLNEKERREKYFEAIGHMVQLHQEGTELENPDFVGFKRAFTEKLLFREFMHYVEYGIEARKNLKVESEDMKVIDLHMRKISEELAAEPLVVVHRDFQSRNILIKNGKIRIIDFQDALMGVRQYDLVSFLRDSYVVLSPEIINACIERYCDLVEERTGERIDREHFLRIFHLQTLQRKIKDAGRFDYIDIVKKKSNFLKYIPASIKYVKDAFESLPEHRPMQEKLARHTPELLD